MRASENLGLLMRLENLGFFQADCFMSTSGLPFINLSPGHYQRPPSFKKVQHQKDESLENEETVLIGSPKFQARFRRILDDADPCRFSPRLLKLATDEFLLRAQMNPKKENVFNRVGRSRNSIYIQLSKDRYYHLHQREEPFIANHTFVNFYWSDTQLEHPDPIFDPKFKFDISEYTNFENPDSNLLCEAWMYKALIPDSGPTPALVLAGQFGSGKSSITKFLKSVIDPSEGAVIPIPNDMRDLMAIIANTFLCAFDNCSGIPKSISDAFCMIITGGAFAVRTLFSTFNLSTIKIQRPIILNGIGLQAKKTDADDRLLVLKTKKIVGATKSEVKVQSDLNQKLPQILGTTYHTLAKVFHTYLELDHDGISRFPDFEKVGIALEKVKGLPEGTFMRIYLGSSKRKKEDTFWNDSICESILTALRQTPNRNEFGEAIIEGNSTELLELLSTVGKRKLKYSPRGFSIKLDEIEPLLNTKGIRVSRTTTPHKRIITITKDVNENF